ncbi:MAG: M1 family metallopeptidase [Flavobacteriales bacterium]|nr:M1 family metallopeptidase [Flavobacteriales bacterium]
MKSLHTIFLILMILFSASAIAQCNYWQQEVDYDMEIDMDVKQHQFKGKQKLIYTNHSPDTLYKVFYHLYFNAFQPGSEMDTRSRSLPDPDRRIADRISKLSPEEIGYHRITILKQDNEPVKFQVQGTILEVALNKPILPGHSATFYMEFKSQVPVQIRRSGRNSAEGVDYSMAQWYPKLCEYDEEGWHTDPYIGREFYGVWGNFRVKITIDSKYTLGATGYLQNPNEVGHGYEEQGVVIPKKDKITWHFYAPRVHDFMWAADRNYVVEQAKVPDGPKLYFIYQSDTIYANKWKNLPPYMIKFFQLMSKKFGKYPYEVFSFIQGGDGGMEYPMATLVTASGSFEGLVSVCVHEAAHNWYYGVLATNESLYPWMDEGFTTYAQDYILNILFNQHSENPFQGNYGSYYYLVKSPDREPLTTHADFYKRNRTYGISSYSAGAVFLHQLSYIVGQEAFDRGMLRYFDEWKFKHPKPNDFIRVMEKTSGLELNWYLEQFINSLNVIDYGIQSVKPVGNNTEITLQRIGDFPMPLDIVVETTSHASTHVYYIPLDIMRGEKQETYKGIKPQVLPDWMWVYTTYTFTVPIPMNNITSVMIDPSGRMADLVKENNTWKP